ncbi:MAG: zinc-ribbon and DUF3426 domain-containing protein [Burkholderiaceae bacterium]|nr:zinc-ribbon and DUF3426 domain-containing protein [Burkholderiaceae bacterium]
MSLATRCPVCQTVFRVVQDQLKVSEGWVRCGRCAKVFNAFEGLFDLEREFPALRSATGDSTTSPSQRVLEDLARRNPRPQHGAQWEQEFDTRAAVRDTTPSAASPTARATAAPAPFKHSAPAPFKPSAPAAFKPSAPAPFQPSAPPAFKPSAPAPQGTAAAAPDDATVAPRSAPRGTPPVAAPEPQPAPARDVEIRDEPAPLADAAAESAGADENSFEALFRSDGELAEPATAADGVDITIDEVEPAALDDAVDSRLLTFVQQADKAERWRRPWVRAAMAVSALGLALLLAAQIVVARRDAVVAHWPQWRSLVQALCSPFDCRIEPLRRIDQISVDSSGLTRIDDGPVYRLALVLRNRSDTPLLTPAIDLSLTDASGALVSRRMLNAGELGASRTTIAPQQELPLQALLMSAERPLTGYTIEIFYP